MTIIATWEDFSWLEIFVQALPEVVLESADDQVKLEEDGGQSNNEEYREEQQEMELSKGKVWESVKDDDEDGLNIVTKVRDLNVFAWGNSWSSKYECESYEGHQHEAD